MKKFEVKDLDKKFVVTCNHWWDEKESKWCYYFYNTTVGDIKLYSNSDHTHHLHPLMILLELSYARSDIWWCNGSSVTDSFDHMCKTMLDDQDYFKPMFRMCTEYTINYKLKDLNDLIGYTEYWTE